MRVGVPKRAMGGERRESDSARQLVQDLCRHNSKARFKDAADKSVSKQQRAQRRQGN
jgi:hypothetical protein